MAIAAWTSVVRENLWFDKADPVDFKLHPLVLMFAISGSLMISRLHISKP